MFSRSVTVPHHRFPGHKRACGLPPGLTDIQHQGHSPGKDVQNGDHGAGRSRVPCRLFTPEFKAEIVELCRRGDRSIGQVARDFDLTETNVRTWVKQAEIDQGERPGLTTQERAELTRLRRENRSLLTPSRSSSERQLSSRRRPGEGGPLHRGGESRRSQLSPRACELLEVSKSAYYQRRNGARSAGQLSDAELLEQITAIHKESNGSYAPRGCTRSCSNVTWPAGSAR